VLIPVLGSQPAGDVSHKPGGWLPLISARHSVTLATLKRAATNFAAWWTDARWVWTACLRLLPDSVAAAIWTPGPFCAWVRHANHSATESRKWDDLIHSRSIYCDDFFPDNQCCYKHEADRFKWFRLLDVLEFSVFSFSCTLRVGPTTKFSKMATVICSSGILSVVLNSQTIYRLQQMSVFRNERSESRFPQPCL